MRTLFSLESIWEIERYNIRLEGRRDELEENVRNLREAGFDNAKIATLLKKDLTDVEAMK